MGLNHAESGLYVDPQAVKHRAMKMKAEMRVMKEFRLKRGEDAVVRKRPRGSPEK